MHEIENNVRGCFWTVLDEMVEELEGMGYEVEDYNDEYVSIVEDDTEYLLYLGHANTTMWVETIREF